MHTKHTRTKTPARSLFAAIAVALGVSICATPASHALFFNYYRDYVSGVSAADWNDANVAANIADCAGAVSGPELRTLAESVSALGSLPLPTISFLNVGSPGYPESYYEEGYAVYNYYIYYAFSFPEYLEYYSAIAIAYQAQYDELGDAWADYYFAQAEVALDAFSASAGSAAASQFSAAFATLYGSVWLGNDADYAIQEATYNYNLWVSSGVPYYALRMWYGGLADYYAGIAQNVRNSVLVTYFVSSASSLEEFFADADAAAQPYEEQAQIWSIWEDYYRGLSDYYEG